MKKIIQCIVLIVICFQSYGQKIVTFKGIFPENVCVKNAVYFLPTGKAKPTEPIPSIEARLNKAIPFIKDHFDIKSKPAIQLAINCKGEIGGGFQIVTSSGNDEIDKEIIKFLKTVTSWKPGLLKKKPVDSWYLWKMEIKDGYIDILNQ